MDQDLFEAVTRAIKDADKFLVEVGASVIPVSSPVTPTGLKAKYLRTVIRAFEMEKKADTLAAGA